MPVTRVNYFDRQFLKVDEFIDEQKYHVGARRRLTQAFQDWGIVLGLEVKAGTGSQVTVSRGIAVDKAGQEIVLEPESSAYAVPEMAAGKAMFVTIAYGEKPDPNSIRSSSPGAPPMATRMLETAEVKVSADQPAADGSVVTLAMFTPTAAGMPVARGEALDGGVRRYAGAKRLAAGAQAMGAFGVQGPLIVQGTLLAKDALVAEGSVSALGTLVVQGALAANGTVDVQGPLAVRGPLTVQGAATLGNLAVGAPVTVDKESWNRNVEFVAGDNIRLTVRTTAGSDPIDARMQVHSKEWWGAKPGLFFGTKSPHALSFGVAGAVKMSIGVAEGVVVSAPLSVTGPNATSFSSDVTAGRDLRVAGDVKAQAQISSPMWKVTPVFSNMARGLPLSAPLATSGGRLLVFMNGSGWANTGGVSIGMSLWITTGDRTRECGSTSLFVNPGVVGYHLAFPGTTLVVRDLAAGNHTITLNKLEPHTATDGGDYFSVTVLELPFF